VHPPLTSCSTPKAIGLTNWLTQRKLERHENNNFCIIFAHRIHLRMQFSNSDNEDMLQLPKAKVFTFLQLRAQEETVWKMVLQVIKDCTLPTKLHQAQFHTKRVRLASELLSDYNYFTKHTFMIFLRNRDFAGKNLTRFQHGIKHPWDF
jgi:hypothetical protein